VSLMGTVTRTRIGMNKTRSDPIFRQPKLLVGSAWGTGVEDSEFVKMEITNVNEYEAIAKEKLPKMVYDYYASGAEDQWTLKENRNAFTRILFRPRILIDVTKIDMTTTVLGYKISMPIMIAPTAMQKMAHPDGRTPPLSSSPLSVPVVH
ncbi:hypothetical protein Taro_038290, partial [Colocasia esculenta]|nr:hypothetical protein [Colocasia esculenta]